MRRFHALFRNPLMSDTVADKVDDARFRFRVRRIKRQMED
jgi:hypothetical protein